MCKHCNHLPSLLAGQEPILTKPIFSSLASLHHNFESQIGDFYAWKYRKLRELRTGIAVANKVLDLPALKEILEELDDEILDLDRMRSWFPGERKGGRSKRSVLRMVVGPSESASEEWARRERKEVSSDVEDDEHDLSDLSGVKANLPPAIIEQSAQAVRGWRNRNHKAVCRDAESTEVSLVSILGGGLKERPPIDRAWERGEKPVDSHTLDKDRPTTYTKAGSDYVYDHPHFGMQANAANLDKIAPANIQASQAKRLVSILRKRVKRGKIQNNALADDDEQLFQNRTTQNSEVAMTGGLGMDENDEISPETWSEIDSESALQTTVSSRSNSEKSKAEGELRDGFTCADDPSCDESNSSTRQSFWEKDRQAGDSIILSEMHDEEEPKSHEDPESVGFSGIHYTAEESEVEGDGECRSPLSTAEDPNDDGKSGQSWIKESCGHVAEARKKDQESEKSCTSDISTTEESQSKEEDKGNCLRHAYRQILNSAKHIFGVDESLVHQQEDGPRAHSPLLGEWKEADHSGTTSVKVSGTAIPIHSAKIDGRRIQQRLYKPKSFADSDDLPQPRRMKEELDYLGSLGLKLSFDPTSIHLTTLELAGQKSDDSPTRLSELSLSEATARGLGSRKKLRRQRKTSNLCSSTLSNYKAVLLQPSSPLSFQTVTKKVTSGDRRSDRAKKMPASGNSTRNHSLLNTIDSLSLLHNKTGAFTSHNRPGNSTTKQQSSGTTSLIRASLDTTGTHVLHKGPLSRLEYAHHLRYTKLISTLAETESLTNADVKTLENQMPSETNKQAPSRSQHTSQPQHSVSTYRSATSKGELPLNTRYPNGLVSKNSSSRAIILEYSSSKADSPLNRRSIKERNSADHPAQTSSTATTQRSRVLRKARPSIDKYSNTVTTSHNTSQSPKAAEHTFPVMEVRARQVDSRGSLKLLNDQFQSRLKAETLKSEFSQNMDKGHMSSSRSMLREDIEPLSMSQQKSRSSASQDVPTFDRAQLKNVAKNTPQSRSIERTFTNDEVWNGMPDNQNMNGLPTPESMTWTSSAGKSSGGRHNALVTPESRRSLSVAATLGYGSRAINTMSESPKSRQAPQHLRSRRDTMDIDRRSISPGTSDFRPSPPRPIEGEYEKRKRIEASRKNEHSTNVESPPRQRSSVPPPMYEEKTDFAKNRERRRAERAAFQPPPAPPISNAQNKAEHSKRKEKREEQRTLAEPTSPLHKSKNKEQGYGTNYKMEDRQKYWKTEKP